MILVDKERSKMKKITIKDIAKIAGVTHPTVSRSLNDSNLVSPKTKEKIKKIADELGFEFNASARRLKTQKTETIAVIFPTNFYHIEAEQFFRMLQKNLIESVEKNSYNVIFQTAENSFTGESNIKKVIAQNQVDGIIIALNNLKKEDIEYIKRSKKECLFLYYKNEIDENSKYFGVDNFYGGYIATKHLIENGGKKIATISCDDEISEFYDRTRGYKKALEEAKIKLEENLIFNRGITFESGFDWVSENKDIINELDAVFVQTDLMAFGVLQGLKKIGLKVPEDISIIGYDDVDYCKYFSPQLTTIHQPIEDLVKKACQELINKLEGKSKKMEGVVLKPYLVKRGSV